MGSSMFHASSKKGVPNRGSGLSKIQGIDPTAQTIIESLQPYHRGASYRDDPLWRLHELARIDKHRLLHVVAWEFVGFGLDLDNCRNVHGIDPGYIHSYFGSVEGRAKVASFQPVPVDPEAEMHVEIVVPLDIAFPTSNVVAPEESVRKVLADIYTYIGPDVLHRQKGKPRLGPQDRLSSPLCFPAFPRSPTSAVR
jgi:hypothetical protein